jgi:flagellar basal body P-ring formation protein FlgA
MTRPALARALLSALLALTVVTLAGNVAAAAGLPAQLKPSVLLEGDVIRLGDLWDNVGDKAETPLASAPQPGKRVTLESRWLMAVANAYGIDWRPASMLERAVVERAGQSVDIQTIETELREALTMEGAPAGASVEVTNRSSLQIIVPVGTPQTVAVRDVSYDARMNRFTAVVEVPAGSPTATRVKVAGHVYATARIPVLSHPMGRGDVISEKDLQWLDVREEVIRRDVVTNPRQLVGQEPRYQLRSGVPVRTAEVQRPVTVAKNSPVTMILKTRFMQLSAQGKAIEDGSQGDIIRVTNNQTKQTVEARVEGPGIVSVTPGGMHALAN